MKSFHSKNIDSSIYRYSSIGRGKNRRKRNHSKFTNHEIIFNLSNTSILESVKPKIENNLHQETKIQIKKKKQVLL